MINGSPLESLARRAYALILNRRRSAADIRNEQYNEQTLAVMQCVLKPDSNCIDVGCHSGLVLRDILNLAPQGQHFAFEPLPDFYTALQNDFRDYPNVQFLNLALSDESGEIEFQHVVTNPGYSGLRRRQYDSDHEQIETISVNRARLDDVLSQQPPCPIHFIKIDVEGAESLVFRGAEETLRRYRPYIVFEHGGPSLEYGSGPEDIHDFLFGCGLRVSLMEAWLKNSQTSAMTKAEFHRAFYNQGQFYYMAHP